MLAAETITPVQLLGLVAVGLAAMTASFLQWVGRLGPNARYQTPEGSGAAGLPGGLGIVIIALGLALRDGLGQPDDWWLWWVLSIIGFSLMMIALVYLVAYFWLGVPDALRPRPQRGQSKPPPLLLGRRRR